MDIIYWVHKCMWTYYGSHYNLLLNPHFTFYLQNSFTMFFCQLDLYLCYAYLLNHVQHCDSVDCSLPGPSFHGILQTRILEWVAVPSSRGSSWPRDPTCVSFFTGIDRWVTTSATWEAQYAYFSATFSVSVPLY